MPRFGFVPHPNALPTRLEARQTFHRAWTCADRLRTGQSTEKLLDLRNVRLEFRVDPHLMKQIGSAGSDGRQGDADVVIRSFRRGDPGCFVPSFEIRRIQSQRFVATGESGLQIPFDEQNFSRVHGRVRREGKISSGFGEMPRLVKAGYCLFGLSFVYEEQT